MSDARTDADLLELWRGGDLEAGDVLVGRHFDALYRFLANKTDSGLEDIVQDTLLACLAAQPGFRGDSEFRTYLFTIARHKLYRYVRKNKRADFDPETDSIASVSPSPSTLARCKDQERLVFDALRGLPLELQVVLELYYWQELSARQIGLVLELPEGTVRGRIRRSRQLLARALERLGVHSATNQDGPAAALSSIATVPIEPPSSRGSKAPT